MELWCVSTTAKAEAAVDVLFIEIFAKHIKIKKVKSRQMTQTKIIKLNSLFHGIHRIEAMIPFFVVVDVVLIEFFFI